VGDVVDLGATPDGVIKRCVGEFGAVCVIGYRHDGDLEVRISDNLTDQEAYFLIEQAKFSILAAHQFTDE
jgi:hypothetical protein